MLKTYYFTFGQDHMHFIDGILYDKDCIVKITAQNPRDVMFHVFGVKWGSQYAEKDLTPEFMKLFRRGIIEYKFNS